MNDQPTIDPCPFCGGEAQIIEGEVSFSVGCMKCGAVGRMVFLDKAPVIAAAIAAWNIRNPTSPPAKRATHTHSSGATTEPGGGGTGRSKQGKKIKTNGTSVKDRKPIKPKPPESGAPGINQEDLRQRLQAWFTQHQTNPDKAVKREHKELGASAATLYHILKGKPMSQATLANITAALDKIDNRTSAQLVMAKWNEPGKVEVMPDKLEKGNGINPLPNPTAPARCSRTP